MNFVLDYTEFMFSERHLHQPLYHPIDNRDLPYSSTNLSRMNCTPSSILADYIVFLDESCDLFVLSINISSRLKEKSYERMNLIRGKLKHQRKAFFYSIEAGKHFCLLTLPRVKEIEIAN